MKYFSDFGVAGVLLFIVYYLLKYIKTKDDLIQELLNVNQEQNLAIKEISTYMKEVSENQKACFQYSKYGRWWIDTHNPTLEICECCVNYQICPHPRKIVLRNRPIGTETPPIFPLR